MKKLTTGLLITLVALVLLSVTAFAVPPKPATGPFEGTFTGTVKGDLGSQTTLTLDLTDRANIVSGEATLGTGLKVNAGKVCGTAVVPGGTIWAEGEKSPRKPRELSAASTLEVSGMDVTIEVSGQLAADGKTLDVTAKIDTPWICGRDPVITGTLTKIQ